MEKDSLYKIFQAIDAERKRQDQKWGEQNHSLFSWMSILGEEYGELCKAINHAYWGVEMNIDTSKPHPMEKVFEELVHTTAVSIAILEALDRDKWKWQVP